MQDDLHLSIAVRRTRRGSLGPLKVAVSRREESDEGTGLLTPGSSTTSTPRKSKKRVRFSDPGPILCDLEDELSTGLTPMIRRTSLSSRAARRHSTPLRQSSSCSGIGIPPLDSEGSPFGGEVHFLPLRQVLDGRVKRRIRRNGLSEEMNVIYAERKRRAQETKAEIERLKAELAEKDEEIHRMQDQTVEIDTERVWDLEQQVEALKRELANRSGVQQIPSSPAFGWAVAPRDPFSDDFMDLDSPDEVQNDVFGETTMADLACSTPTRRARGSFPTPPATSPTGVRNLPTMPCKRLATPPPPSHVGVQAALPDPEKQQLEDELASLQLEICKLTTTLESYSSFTARLADKLDPYSPHLPSESVPAQDQTSHPCPDIEPRLSTVLQLLSDRTAALLELNSSLSGLGFPGSDGSEIITSLSTSFRTARLELEYLTPGEVTLPLSSAGAQVLDMILSRLRELAKKNKESDETIDEYHSIELSLRQQLGSRVDAMDTLKKDMNQLEGEMGKKDAYISEMEVGLERLKGAVSRYTRDVSELESLVQHMEEELVTSNDQRKQQQITHEQTIQQQAKELSQKSSALSDLETKLSSAAEQTESLQQQLTAVHTAHQQALQNLRSNNTAEVTRLNKSHGQSLALRDARVSELRLEIDRVNASLRSAHETIRQLRVDNSKLSGLNDELTGQNISLASKVETDRVKAKEVIDSMKAELQRVLRMSEGFLVTPKKNVSVSKGLGGLSSLKRKDSAIGDEDDVCLVPSSPASSSSISGRISPGGSGLFSGELAKKKGKKRRRYDSGLGFLDEEEVDVEG